MKILKIAIDVLSNHIDESTRDAAYNLPYDNDWLDYIRGYVNPKETRRLIIDEVYHGVRNRLLRKS